MAGVLIRRVRGVLVSITLWALLGTLLGAGVGLWFALGPSADTFFISGPRVPGGLPGVFALAGAITGALNGLVLALLIALAERRGSVDTIRPWRFALWGGLATFIVLTWALLDPLPAAAFAAVGAGLSAGMLLLARRTPGPDKGAAR
jgi:hypothetical protein